MNGDLQNDWAKLNEIVEGASQYGRGTLAVLKAQELAEAISTQHSVSVTIPESKLTWLRGEKQSA